VKASSPAAGVKERGDCGLAQGHKYGPCMPCCAPFSPLGDAILPAAGLQTCLHTGLLLIVFEHGADRISYCAAPHAGHHSPAASVAPAITSLLLPRVRAGGGLIRALLAGGARTAVAKRLGGGLIICCAVLPAGGAVCGVAGSRELTRWREGVQSRVLGPARGGSSASGSSSSDVLAPAHACHTRWQKRVGHQCCVDR